MQASLRGSLSASVVNTIKTVAASSVYSLPSPVSGLQIEILSGSIVPQLPILVYHGEADCEWDLIIKESGTILVTDSDGQRLPLENRVCVDLQATCIVNGNLLLNATISPTGKVLDKNCYRQLEALCMCNV